MTTLLLFAFLSGMVTIFAPCIWPILPIVLSSGASGGHRRPLGLVVGLSLSFLLATLALAALIQVIPFDPETLRTFSVVVIAFLGLTLVVPAIGTKLEGIVSRFASFGGRFTQVSRSGFGGGFITGFALGIVWSPCAGPILAAVATLAATQSVSLSVVLVALAFAAGVSVPLFILALASQAVLTKTRFFSRYTRSIQSVFGVVMLLAAFALYTGFDKTLQTRILDTFPGYERFLNRLESQPAVTDEIDALKAEAENVDRKEPLQAALPKIIAERQKIAPEFAGLGQWFNSDSGLTLEELRGRVVLVHFWTTGCINCIRTLPHVTSWYERYKDDGFVVVGIHTPEFAYEREAKTVQGAIRKYGIGYPVAQDNDFATWQAYGNRYWPAFYLIDAEGLVRREHFGEGEYQETEEMIQGLIREAKDRSPRR